METITNRLFSRHGAVVDRLLGLADEFLDQWRAGNEDDGIHNDEDLIEREAEWALWRPRIIACVEACENARAYNRHLNALEVPPNGDDYNALLALIEGGRLVLPVEEGR